MAPINISRIILEEWRKLITSKVDVDIKKLDNKLVEYGISDMKTRKLLVKKLILKSNISEALILEDKKAIAALAKEIPKDPTELIKLRKLYTSGNEETKREIEAALRKHYLTKVYTKGDEYVSPDGVVSGAGKQSMFRSKINKIVGLDKDLLGAIVQYPSAKDAAPTPAAKQAEKPAPKQAEPAAEKPKAAADADLEYLNKLQNMTTGDLRKIGLTMSKNKEERGKVIAALKKAPEAAAKSLARKLNIAPQDLTGTAPAAKPQPPAPAAPSKPQPTAPPTVVPVAKKPTASATPTPKPKKKKAPPKPMTGAKARKFKQKYKDFTDGGDDKQISKKFTVSKTDKEKLPKFGKVGKQVKGGSEKQAAGRDTSATAHVSGDNVPTGDKGDSVSCLRGRVMSKDLWNKRETIGMEIMGGGKNKKTGKPLPFGRNRWSDGVKRDDVADAKAIKAVINFMGAAARYGYDPVKYWPNFLWATATHLVLKGQPKSKECLDPRKPKDVETHRKLQAQKKSKIADGVDITLKEDFCLEGCTEEQIQEANSKRNVKNIAKYKGYVANLRQKSKGMNLDQFLDLIKYKK